MGLFRDTGFWNKIYSLCSLINRKQIRVIKNICLHITGQYLLADSAKNVFNNWETKQNWPNRPLVQHTIVE